MMDVIPYCFGSERGARPADGGADRRQITGLDNVATTLVRLNVEHSSGVTLLHVLLS
jgi:hypothetical protein